MNRLELELLKDIESLENIKNKISTIKDSTQLTLKQLAEESNAAIINYEQSLRQELEDRLNDLTEKYENDIYNLEKQHISNLNNVNRSLASSKESILIEYQDTIENLENTIEDADALKNRIQNLLGTEKYEAYMNVLDKRLDFEVALDSSNDCIDLIGKFKQVQQAFDNLNPIDPENTLTNIINLFIKPYLYIRTLFKDKASQRLLDLATIVTIMFLVINYRIIALSVISGYITTTFITNYYLSSKIYSNFEDYYLIVSALYNDIVDKYKQFILDENIEDMEINAVNNKEALEEELINTKDSLRRNLILAKDKIKNELDIDSTLKAFKDGKLANLNELLTLTAEQSEKQIEMFDKGIQLQSDNIKEKKRKLLDMPWYDPVYKGSEKVPGTEINHISGFPNAIIGYKHNDKYNFDSIHTVPMKDTSYLITHNTSNLDTINNTILMNMINYFGYYKPKLAKATVIDTVSLGKSISTTNILKEYWNIITNKESYMTLLEGLESDIATRNNLISKECNNVHEYNELINKRSGIMLPYHFIYMHSIQDLLTNEIIQKMALQESIGVTLVVLFNMDTISNSKGDIVNELNLLKDKFHYVIDCTRKDVQMIDNKSNQKAYKSILEY